MGLHYEDTASGWRRGRPLSAETSYCLGLGLTSGVANMTLSLSAGANKQGRRCMANILAAMRRLLLARTTFLCLLFVPLPVRGQTAPTFSVSFPAARSAKALDGRVLLLLSNDPSEEPRMQIDDSPKSQMVFGVTVDGWKPGEPLTIGASAQGYPRASLKDVPAGSYTV